MNLLVLLEVADRLSLKNDLEIARDIQQAMLPSGVYSAPGVETVGIEPSREHRRRRLLRHPAARRRPAGDCGRRRRRQRQPGGAADGAAAGDAAHAGRRKARAGRPHHAAERAGLPACARHAVHHAVLRGVSAADRRPDLRQRRPHAAAGAARATAPASGSPTAASRSACSSIRRTRPATSCSRPDDLLAVYSDGITEAENPTGTPFDEDRPRNGAEGQRPRDACRRSARRWSSRSNVTRLRSVSPTI